MATNRRSSRPRRRTVRLVPARAARSLTVKGLAIADGAVTPGTTRLTDLGSLWEGVALEELAGRLITNVHGYGSHIGSTGGLQSYTYALFIANNDIDAADVGPATGSSEYNWWLRVPILHRAQQHNVGAGQEFDSMRLNFNTRGTRRMPRAPGMTLWFAEETVTQAQTVSWGFDIATSE